MTIVSYLQEFMHFVLVNCLGDLILPRNSVSWSADALNIALIVWLGGKP